MPFPTAGFGSGWDQGAGTGEIEFALKNFYLPGMEEQKNNARVLLANVERNERDVSGSYAFVPLLLGRNWGIGMRANRQQLPDPGAQAGVRAQIPMRYAFGRLIVTLHAMTATKNSEGSYDTVIDVETEGLMEDLPKDINRQLFLDGAGRLGKLSADPVAGTTIDLDNADLDAPRAPSGATAEFTKYIEVGMRIDFIDPGGPSARAGAGRTVASITDANTFEIDAGADAGVADNDWVSVEGNYGIELTGLLAMVSASGTYQGVNRATGGNERWQANEVTAPGATLWSTTVALAEADMQTTWTACEKASGIAPNMILGTYEARDAYAALLESDRRFVNTIEYRGGFKGPEFHDVGLIPDTEAPKGYLWFLNTSYMAIYQQAGLQFMDDDGAVLSRVSDYPAYEATLYWFFELGARRCNCHARLQGLSV